MIFRIFKIIKSKIKSKIHRFNLKKYEFGFFGQNSIVASSFYFSNSKNIFIQDNVYIGPRSFISSFGKVTIGKGSIIGPNITIHTANHNFKGDITTIPYDKKLVIKDVVIGEGVWIGGNVILIPGVKIGNGVVIAGGSVVTKNIEEYTIVGGNPAVKIGVRDNIELFKRLHEKEKYYMKAKLNKDE